MANVRVKREGEDWEICARGGAWVAGTIGLIGGLGIWGMAFLVFRSGISLLMLIFGVVPLAIGANRLWGRTLLAKRGSRLALREGLVRDWKKYEIGWAEVEGGEEEVMSEGQRWERRYGTLELGHGFKYRWGVALGRREREYLIAFLQAELRGRDGLN